MLFMGCDGKVACIQRRTDYELRGQLQRARVRTRSLRSRLISGSPSTSIQTCKMVFLFSLRHSTAPLACLSVYHRMPDAEAATTLAPLRVDQQAGHLSPQVLLSRMRQSKQGTPSGADHLHVLPGRKSNTVTRLTRDTRAQLVRSFGKTRSAVCMARVRDEATTSCMLCCTEAGTAWCRVFACTHLSVSTVISWSLDLY